MGPRLPLFPLEMVLFPGLVLPLHVFEKRYRELVRHLTGLSEGTPREFGVVAVASGWSTASAGDERPPTVDTDHVTLHEVGCSALLRRVTPLPGDRFDVLAVGHRRFRIIDIDRRSQPYLTARIEWLTEPEDQGDVELLAARVLAAFRQYLDLVRATPAPVAEQLPDDPTTLSHLVAAAAMLTVAERQSLLAAPDTNSRLRAELRFLSREAALLRRVRAVPVPLVDLPAPSPSPN